MHAIEINLLQSRPKQVEPGRLLPILLLVTGAAAIGLMIWMYMDANASIRATQAEIEQTEQLIVTLQGKQLELQTTNLTAALIDLPAQIRNNYAKPSEVLAALTELLPEKANLASITYVNGQTIKVTGMYTSTEDLVTFMQAIEHSPVFRIAGNGGIEKVRNNEPIFNLYMSSILATFEVEILHKQT